jgi:DNA polymerase-4
MDAFYASIEQRDDPKLRGKPVIVGATSARGVVAAASYEARGYGVRSAMPGFEARRLCPHGVFLPSNMALYSRVSDEVHEVFHSFSPEVEPIALDEAFIDISGSVALFGGPIELGRRLKRAVREAVGLSVSVGIGPNKLVAKLACTFSKPDGLIYVPDDVTMTFLYPLPVRRLWGVGPVLERTLSEMGIRTIGELARSDPEALRRAVGDRAAELLQMARGIDSRAVEAHLAPKSYGEENTFERDVSDRETVTAALTAHAEAVARRLRRDGYRGRTVTLKVKLGTARGRRATRLGGGGEPVYPLLTRSHTMSASTADGAKIREVAVRLWDAASIDEPVRLLGVSVSNLDRGEGEQLELFGHQSRLRSPPRGRTDRPRDEKLGVALDAIVDRFGRTAISRAVSEPEKATHSGRRKRGDAPAD